MCFAIPGKITKIEDDLATVEYYNKDKRTAKIIEEGYSEGDYVIVQAKIIVQKVPEEDALKAIELTKQAKGEL